MPNIFVLMVVKRILVLSFIFLCLNQFILAQSGTIIAANDGQPLPYATIINLRTGKGVFASATGQVDFKSDFFSIGDSVKISYTGYADSIMQLPILQDRITLQFHLIDLENVAVFPCSHPSPTVLKNYKKYVTNYSFGMGGGGSGTYAAYVPNSEFKKGIIKSITIEQSFFTVPSNARKAPFKIRLLHYDTLTEQPGKSIIAKEWIINPTSNKSVINILDENLRLPNHGLVVCIDYFFAGKQYTYKRKTTSINSDGSKKNELLTYYGGGFRSIKGDNLIGAGYMMGSKSGEWRIFNSYQSGVAAPMVSIGIMECN